LLANVVIEDVRLDPFIPADKNITIPLQAPLVLLRMISSIAVKPATKSGVGVVNYDSSRNVSRSVLLA